MYETNNGKIGHSKSDTKILESVTHSIFAVFSRCLGVRCYKCLSCVLNVILTWSQQNAEVRSGQCWSEAGCADILVVCQKKLSETVINRINNWSRRNRLTYVKRTNVQFERFIKILTKQRNFLKVFSSTSIVKGRASKLYFWISNSKAWSLKETMIKCWMS